MNCDFKIDFVGIGATKSGTTWLANCLRAHPEICLSEPKEVRYFNSCSVLEHHYLMTKENEHSLKERVLKDLTWYVNHFRHCDPHRIKGEFSPVYLYDEKTPFLIHRYFPTVKLIVCLRNPIDRAYSHYWMYKGSKVEKRTFEDSIAKKNIYVEMGFYSKQLKRYLKYFDQDQMMILLSDDMLKNPQGEFDKVLRFLNVRTDVKIDMLHISSNSAKKTRAKFVHKGLHFASRTLISLKLSSLLRVLRKMGFHDLFTKLNTSQLKYPDMNSSTREYLRSVFKDDIKELGLLINRDLSHWQ